MSIAAVGDRSVTDCDRLKMRSVMHQLLQSQLVTGTGDRCDRYLHKSDRHAQERAYVTRVTICHVSRIRTM